MQRSKALPIMRTTMKQLDGTATPKNVLANDASSPAEGIRRRADLDEFGQAFYLVNPCA